jgi:hypothetical protein
MTLKDQFDVSGYDSTLGYVGRAFKPATQDCVLVTILKSMGAIIIAIKSTSKHHGESGLGLLLPNISYMCIKIDVYSGVRPTTRCGA